jgi:Icc-related predicted phosphoesterase
MSTSGKRVRVAALADLHYGKGSPGTLQTLFSRINDKADVLLLCGDLTDHGLPEEAQGLVREMTAALKIPVLAVLGNHDWHAGKHDELERILEGSGVRVLDGEDCEVQGIGFTGVKGFGGGFGRHTLEAWGEDLIKRFVHEAVEEALKLEKSLARLSTPQRIVLLHYAPIQATVEGEPAAIFPFLGSSRLEEPLNRYAVTAVFHGHAHHGSPEGRTREGVPVYNISLPVLREHLSAQDPFRVLEVPPDKEEAGRKKEGKAALEKSPSGASS